MTVQVRLISQKASPSYVRHIELDGQPEQMRGDDFSDRTEVATLTAPVGSVIDEDSISIPGKGWMRMSEALAMHLVTLSDRRVVV